MPPNPADACKRVAAIVVDAKFPKAATFYQHFGLIELPGQPGRWMLPRSQYAFNEDVDSASTRPIA